MRTKILMFIAVCLVIGKANAQWAVFDPSNLAQGIVNTTKQIVQTSQTATNTINTFKETMKVYEQGKQYYDALKSVNNLVKDARKVQKTILMVGEITDIYVVNFQLMLSDRNFRPEELNAIAYGYSRLLDEAADVLGELKTVINISTLSMSDKERMDVIDWCYDSVRNYRDLTKYYTRKNISVSYVRSKESNDQTRFLNLYGSSEDRYW